MRLRRSTCPPPPPPASIDQHFVDVGRPQLEYALQAAVRRDRLDSQLHALEQRARVSERTYLQPEAPALARVRILHDDQRVRILRDVAAALVEELERQRDVRRIDVVDVAQIRGVRDAVARTGEELRRQQSLKAGRQRLERRRSSERRAGARAWSLVEERRDPDADGHRRPDAPPGRARRAECQSARG